MRAAVTRHFCMENNDDIYNLAIVTEIDIKI